MGNALCSAYGVLSARHCVTCPTPGRCLGVGCLPVHPTPPHPRSRGSLLLFPPVSFTGFQQCPKGTRFYCPSLRSFRRWGGGAGEAVCFPVVAAVPPFRLEGPFSELPGSLLLYLREPQSRCGNEHVYRMNSSCVHSSQKSYIVSLVHTQPLAIC